MRLQRLLHIEFTRHAGYNIALTQSVHLVRFVSRTKNSTILLLPDAQRLENTTPHVHRYPPDSLRRDGPSSAFLQQAWAPSFVATVGADLATQCRLSSFRYDPGSSLCDHGRAAPVSTKPRYCNTMAPFSPCVDFP